jgi:hypothetical protein
MNRGFGRDPKVVSINLGGLTRTVIDAGKNPTVAFFSLGAASHEDGLAVLIPGLDRIQRCMAIELDKARYLGIARIEVIFSPMRGSSTSELPACSFRTVRLRRSRVSRQRTLGGVDSDQSSRRRKSECRMASGRID